MILIEIHIGILIRILTGILIGILVGILIRIFIGILIGIPIGILIRILTGILSPMPRALFPHKCDSRPGPVHGACTGPRRESLFPRKKIPNRSGLSTGKHFNIFTGAPPGPPVTLVGTNFLPLLEPYICTIC